ncbi:MAG: ABC transporter permease [Oscillospiraceae bacterium]|nr:ABC transporter permease [Oscillospiraceae bacterium]MBQ4651110.1 ABC transporter permease [Oscillospiraceae bacterium]
MIKTKNRIPPSLLAFLVLMVAWVLATMVFKVVTYTFLPSPVDLAEALWSMRKNLLSACLASLRITMSGFLIGLTVGLLMGLLMAYSKAFMDTVGPFMEFTRPIPVFALIPLFMIWFGLGILPQVFLVALGVMGIIGVQTYEAIKNMPLIYIRASQNLGANKKTIFKTVVIPYIIPHLVGAIRVAAATSWGLDVAAEFMGVQIGLGYNMIVQQMYLNTPGIMVIVLIYCCFAIILDKIIAAIERRLTVWTDRAVVTFEGIK